LSLGRFGLRNSLQSAIRVPARMMLALDIVTDRILGSREGGP